MLTQEISGFGMLANLYHPARVEREAREELEYLEKLAELENLEISKIIFDNMSRDILENTFKCKKN